MSDSWSDCDVVIVGAGLFALATSINSTFSWATKSVLIACEDGWLPKGIAVVNKRFNTPHILLTFLLVFGATPIIAQMAQDVEALTVAVVTKPFSFEGGKRMQVAEEGMAELTKHVDSLITIPNDRLLKFVERNTNFTDAMSIADDVLRQGIQGISELITVPGLINLDFADVKTTMSKAGLAIMGIGIASGDTRGSSIDRTAPSRSARP